MTVVDIQSLTPDTAVVPAPAAGAPPIAVTAAEPAAAATPSGNTTAARLLHLLAAASALAGIVLDLVAASHKESWLPANAGFSTTFGPGWGGALNRLAYFTTVSNLLVAAVSLALVVRPDPRSRLFGALRMSALASILLTGTVYAMILLGPSLGGDYPLTMILQTTFEHILTPLLALAAWIVSLRRPPSWGELALTPVLPALYLAVTLARGALVDWYPYSFVDVPALGYRQVLLNAALVAVLVPVIAGTLAALGHWLVRAAGAERT